MKRKRQTNTQEEKHVRKLGDTIYTQKKTIEHLKEILDKDEIDMTPAEMHKIGEQFQNKAHQQIDIPYIKSLLFPELYSAEMPQPLCNISYTRFSDSQQGTITTNATGEGLLIWMPQTNHGPSIFVYNGALSAKDNTWLTKPTAGKTLYGMPQAYDRYFTQTALSAASISFQYTGQTQLEQGFLIASIITGIDPSELVVSDIEDGQNKAMANPRDGMRVVYMPKDSNDYNFYAAAPQFASNNGGRISYSTQTFVFPVGDNSPAQWLSGSAFLPKFDKDITYSASSEYVAIYWKGLPANQPIRVDTMRRFHGTPKTAIRDIVELEKPKRTFDAKKTVDVVNDLQINIPQLQAHSIASINQVSDRVQQLLPNLGHMYHSGNLKNAMNLKSFARNLAIQDEGQSDNQRLSLMFE